MKTPFFFVSVLFVVVISGFCAESQVLVSEHKLPGRHFQLTQVQLVDQTDKHNELVQTGNWLLHRSESTLKLKGNLFVLHDNHTNRGWIFVRQSPLPEARPVTPQTDIEIRRKKDHVMVRLFRTDDEKVDDLWQKLPYQGGLLQRTRALQDWQRSLRPDTPLHRIPNFATNTWGDRNRDSRICEDFILKEIDAAKELGADVVQIDDGWQHGRSGNSAFQSKIKTQGLTGFWDASDSFWQVDPERFPNGLKPVIEKAKNAGIEIGLWYAPDSDDDFLNWEKDAANIVALHEKYGIRHFKIDGLQVDSPAGQKRVQQLLSTLMQRSDSNILIDLDITGGDKRPGYFGAIRYGLLYVENRYIDWQNYWPHHTLRNLWELTSWVDPGRLRIEFLNNTRKQELYEGDPLAPANYPADYLFASVMMSNPLGFFEVSNLPDDYLKSVASLVKVWRNHRKALFDCTIIPIGEEPSGFSWTGFMAANKTDDTFYCLFLREFSDQQTYTYDMPVCLGSTSVLKILHGTGSATVNGEKITVTIPQTPGHLFLKTCR